MKHFRIRGRALAVPAPLVRRSFTLLFSTLALAAAPAAAVADPGRGDPSGEARNPIERTRLYVSPASHARRQAEAWRRSRPRDAALMDRMAQQAQAEWFGDWNHDVRGDVDRLVSAAAYAGTVPVLVAYNIPQRDCGHYSAGGARGAGGYRQWIRAFAEGIRGRRAVVILEPDALMVTNCLSAPRLEERLRLIREAVEVLKARGATVYVDAGSASGSRPDEMAARLTRAGIARADGFALNVSNFVGNARNIAHGEQISRRVGGKHFVIDTSRNGAGIASGGEWCNAPGQALGAAPTTRTGHALVDAFLWVKRPGESDGTCHGGPQAGQWWADYALGLAKRQPGSLASR
jgi:endoglucanase